MSDEYLQDESGEGAKELEEFRSDRMKVVQLDVCSEEQVNRAVEYIKDNLEDSERGNNETVTNADKRSLSSVTSCHPSPFRSLGRGEQRRRVNIWRSGVYLYGDVQAGVRGQPVGHHQGHQSCSAINPQGQRSAPGKPSIIVASWHLNVTVLKRPKWR